MSALTTELRAMADGYGYNARARVREAANEIERLGLALAEAQKWRDTFDESARDLSAALVEEQHNHVVTKRLAREREEYAELLLHALTVILPMAKGWAHEHQVGDNLGKVQWAEDIARGEVGGNRK